MKKTILFVLSVLLTITIIGSLILLDSKYNLRHFFDDWKPETDDNVVSIINYSSVYDHSGKVLFEMDDVLNGKAISVVYCVKDERVYFSYETKNPETGLRNIWHIASVSVSGENLKEHYSGKLFDDSIKNPTLWDLSRTDRIEEYGGLYGGLYCDNSIYLHGNAKTVVFDLKTEAVKEVNSLPVSRFIGEVENQQIFIVKDTENGTTRTVTLESMGNSNAYAGKLLELSKRRIWSGEAPTNKLFEYAKIVDGQIYIVCKIYNWNGESFAVVFRYDFPSDTVQYLSSNKVGGNVSSRYVVAPYY